jgi:heme oxygenase (biliverdin-producing, ferredoxin)
LSRAAAGYDRAHADTERRMTPLAERLRAATRELHVEVEHAGLMRLLLRGELPRAGYCLLLRNLHAIYAALEPALQRHAGHPQIRPWLHPALARGARLERDLAALHGADWDAIPCMPAASRYAGHLQGLADAQPGRLAAHAYVRYLGDLSGGQALARIVSRSLATDDALAFYDFGGRDAVGRLAAAFRDGLDRVAPDEVAAGAIIDEARAAFVRHRELFDELERVQDGRDLTRPQAAG